MKKIISQNEEINAFIDKEFGADEDNIQSDYGSEIEVFQEVKHEKKCIKRKNKTKRTRK